jgi:type IV secretory pathway TrbF-like protein
MPLAAPVEWEDRTSAPRRRHGGWRVLAVLMTLVVIALAGLLAAWRFAPERVPPMLQPVELMRAVGVTVSAGPVRRPAPPESQFEE